MLICKSEIFGGNPLRKIITNEEEDIYNNKKIIIN